jgi:hypothetical protein
MKADFSNWTHKPENPIFLKAYAENALLEGATRGIVPVVVWRDGEATLTLTPQEGEQIYDFGIVDRRVVEIPEEVKKALEAYDEIAIPEEEVIESSQESPKKDSKP